MTHRNSLTAKQRAMLDTLDDGFDPEDSVGRDALAFGKADRITCMELLVLGLVLVQPGWQQSVWFRLSPRGRGWFAPSIILQ